MTLKAFLIFCLCSLIFWWPIAAVFLFALGRAAKLGDEAMKRQHEDANPFKELKGEQTGSISETRGGNDAAPQLLSMNPKILRGFKTSLAVLLVACAVGCGEMSQRSNEAELLAAHVHYLEGANAGLEVAIKMQSGLSAKDAQREIAEGATNYLRSLPVNSRD